MINQTPVVLTQSRNLLAGDSGQTLLYFGATDITLYVPDNLPRGFGCEAAQLGQGLIRFGRTSEMVSLSSTIEAGVQTVGLGSSVVLWFLSSRSYATRVIGSVDGAGGAVGPAGPPGPPGPSGPAGEAGVAGVQGPAGASGQPGPQGQQGVAGAVGATGATGVAGADGATGAKGDKGDPGPTGAAGTNGAAGAPGADGAPGVAGPQGYPGPQGLQGVKGDTGPEGPTAVSADSGNLARLGTDSLLLVPETSVLKGVTSGTEAAAGTIGEYKVVANTVGVSLGQKIPLTVCSISLTPGDWEIWGTVDFTPPGNVSPTMICAAVSVTTNALPTNTDLMTGVGVLNMFTTAALTSGERQVLMTGQCRSNSAAPLDLYLVGQTNFGGASNRVTAKGYICARRVR